MRNLDVSQSTFGRFGSRYGHFIDPEHFMGRSPFEDNWMTKKPRINLSTENKQYRLQVALPGFTREEINIDLNNHVLLIEAKKVKKKEKKDNFLVKEVELDSMRRKFYLSEDVLVENIKAHFEHGILTLLLPYKDVKKKKNKAVTVE